MLLQTVKQFYMSLLRLFLIGLICTVFQVSSGLKASASDHTQSDQCAPSLNNPFPTNSEITRELVELSLQQVSKHPRNSTNIIDSLLLLKIAELKQKMPPDQVLSLLTETRRRVEETLKHSRPKNESPRRENPEDIRVVTILPRLARDFLGVAGPADAIKISPNGQYLVVPVAHDRIEIRDLQTTDTIKSLGPHIGEVSAAAFSNNSEFLVTAASIEKLSLWRVSDGQLIRHFKPRGLKNLFFDKDHRRAPFYVRFTPDDRFVWAASVEMGNELKRWRVSDGQLIESFKPSKPDIIVSVTTSANDEIMAIAKANGLATGAPGTIELWRKGAKNYYAILQDGVNPIYRIGAPALRSIRLSQDGHFLLSVSLQNSVKIWETESGHLLRTLTKEAHSAEFSPDGRLIATTDGVKVALWRANDGHLITEFKTPKGFAEQAQFTPYGKQILTIVQEDVRYTQRTVTLWDLYSTIEAESPNPDGLTD